MTRILCITGTGTDVGKTSVALATLLWARETGIRAHYLKLVQCGQKNVDAPAEDGFQGDAEWIEAAVPGFNSSAIYVFPDPVSPHLAAEKSGTSMEPEWILHQAEAAAERCDLLVIESAGGAATPLTREGLSLAELAAKGEWSCLVACSPGLGTLHQTRTTAHFLVSHGASLAGFAMSQTGPDRPATYTDNVVTLKSLLKIPFFGLVPFCPGLQKRLPLPPAVGLLFAKSLADGLSAWWKKP